MLESMAPANTPEKSTENIKNTCQINMYVVELIHLTTSFLNVWQIDFFPLINIETTKEHLKLPQKRNGH